MLYRTPGRFKNHVVFYQVLEDAVEIIRVLHASQDMEQALHQMDN
ncbi:MAG: type II toxin-antitoxin system RelE/ParE family toxin [Gemmataceae bacterium]|nr:type II toxin-antitoxin system RelE/ParE family toxin [Gemmataceae bacterium]